jgi:hypothetical protein
MNIPVAAISKSASSGAKTPIDSDPNIAGIKTKSVNSTK